MAESPAHPMTEETQIEADVFPDSDSGYGSVNAASPLGSVTPSTYTFIHENGHRYHRGGETLLPNDDSEQDRLDLQHHIFKLLLDGNLTSTPITPACQNILDVGTGTGIWPIEMGDRYEFASIVGVDESPIQPGLVPPNVQFEIEDVCKPWLTQPNSVDFVHIRTMAGCIRDWPALVGEALKALRPGGRIEISDIVWNFECLDGTMPTHSASVRWANEFHEIAQTEFHVDFQPSPKMAGWLTQAGFDAVTGRSEIVPVGPWPKNPTLKLIGSYMLTQMLEGGMENYSMGLFTKAGWDPAAVHSMLREVKVEIKDPRIHSFTRAWFIEGRKPMV